MDVKFAVLSIVGVKIGVPIRKNNIDIKITSKVKINVKFKLVIVFLIENCSIDLDSYEKYFTSEIIEVCRPLLDAL